MLIQQLCDPGDGVLLATPYWAGLDICVAIQNEAKVVEVDLGRYCDGGTASDDEIVRCYALALGQARRQGTVVKAVLICNPTNPTGECYTAGMLRALLDWAEREELHFISDEAYALSVHGGGAHSQSRAGAEKENHRLLNPTEDKNVKDLFTSVLCLDVKQKNVYVVYTLSKDFGCSGIRLVRVTLFFHPHSIHTHTCDVISIGTHTMRSP